MMIKAQIRRTSLSVSQDIYQKATDNQLSMNILTRNLLCKNTTQSSKILTRECGKTGLNKILHKYKREVKPKQKLP